MKTGYNKHTKKTFLIGLFFLAFLSISNITFAQTSGEETITAVSTMKAQVLSILSQQIENVPDTNLKTNNQTVQAEILDGSQKGSIVTVDNDYYNLTKGEIFYMTYTPDATAGVSPYSVDEPYRLPEVMVLVAIFVLVLFIFGGWQGVRGLASLIGSFALIIFVLLPGILHGFSPILVTFGISSLIIVIGSYITHGFNKTTSSAVLGMIATVAVTGALAAWAVHFTYLTGYNTEEAVSLNIGTSGSINMLGLLLGGIMIGLLGVLYDVAISQAIAVEELKNAAPDMPKGTLYKRAIRIGREHIGALVNTLAIAYVGVSLPLLLLFYISSTGSIAYMINKEIFSAEIVRIMIGSIGLILAVPITTLVSVWMLTRKH